VEFSKRDDRKQLSEARRDLVRVQGGQARCSLEGAEDGSRPEDATETPSERASLQGWMVLRPYPAGLMRAYPVKVRVGNVRNNDAALLDEISLAA
jgi:hypothetical protein